ncbi:MAG: peptidase [Acidobacteria bacterium]|nr:MAG: peptidase [Acidobacteriota bacterium]
MNVRGTRLWSGAVLPAAAAWLVWHVSVAAQDRLKSMPGYEQFQKMSREIPGSVKLGSLNVTWAPDSKTFEYAKDGKRYRYDVAAREATAIGDAPEDAPGRGGGGRGRGQGQGRGNQPLPERGRQFSVSVSPDETLKAEYRNRNLYLSHADGTGEIAITTDGTDANRVKYGTASWVYGEELSQRTAMWWSPDSRKLAFYRFDESKVPDFWLALDLTKVQDRPDVEAYPKPGKPNPVVDLFVYDVATKQTTKLDVRDGKPFENATVGYYVYGVEWSKDGKELLLDRTNRRQNVLEYAACDPASGTCRAIVHEEWPTGWIDESRDIRFLQDGRRFIWGSERTGWKNYYLYDLSGRLIAPLTSHTSFECGTVVRVDEASNLLFYTARDGDNFMKLQLHRVGLDGKGDKRLTDPAFTHTINASPDGRYFIDVAQTHDTPPATKLVDADGTVVAELASSDASKFTQLGLKKIEMFTYKAADGQTTLHGLIHYPSTFDPSKKYPVLASVYGGPAAASTSERFILPSTTTEYGFIVVGLDSRAVPGMGKRSLDSIYLKLGQVEVDDMAEGIRALWNRPYIDKNRVGIYGTSYGGYTAVMELVRHPDVFAAAAASSPPTDWRNYDTIYTERYMWIPEENLAGYDAGSAMTYADKMKGRLLLYYGTADNNVHPSNSLQLIHKLQQLGKSFDLQIGPDLGHSAVNQQRMMEFFIENLVMIEDRGSRTDDRASANGPRSPVKR